MSNKIYIKKIPDKERLTREETVELLNSPYAPRDEIEQFRELLKGMGKTIDEFLDDVFALGRNNGAFREEWSGCKNFWTCAENEDGIIMSEHILNEEAAEKEFKSQEELEKEFISISSFLENANYVGKFFRRTKSIYEDDKEYLPVNYNVFALYELDGIDELKGTIGIAHTRWATHGKPSKINSHPHMDNTNSFAVVHNGIIENYQELKSFLTEKGYTFLSQTDTEVIPNLISYYYEKEKDVLKAVQKTCKDLKGSYAIEIPDYLDWRRY